jgi:hypothetical protein
MMVSLAGGVVVWMVLKAKGLIVAGLVAEVLKVLEEREAQANQHEPAAYEPQVECDGTPQAEEVRGLVQDSSTAGSEGRRALASPEPWGPDELVSFASSLAWQVAKKLSKHDDLVQGVVDRFAEDLRGLSRGPGDPSQAAMAGAWQQEPEDLLWWPMWWCPYPPQWSAAGAEEMPLTADEPAACRPAEVGAQSPVALEHVVQTCRAKPTRRGSKKKGKATESCVVPQVSEPDCELSERSGPSSLQGGSDSSRDDLFGTAERGFGPAASAGGGLEEEGVCCPCLQPEPGAQPAWSSAARGGEEGSPHGEEFGNICVGADSLLRFLSASEWASVQQTARHLCPGFKVSSPASVDIRLLKELLGETFLNGLQEIEGWLDFAGAAEELDLLEQDIWNGGTQSTQAPRVKVFSSLRWRLADFLEQAGRVLAFWINASCEADSSVQDFVVRASVVSSANPHLCAWRVCEPLEAGIYAFVHRVAGGGSGDFSHEAAGNFVLLAEAVEECRKQAWEMQDTLEKLAAESLALGRPLARRMGPPCASVYKKALEEGFSATEALAMASAEPLPKTVKLSACRGN